MRHLIELLNTIASAAARLPSSLPPSSNSGGGFKGMRRRSGQGRLSASSDASTPAPMTAAAAAALPALRAAEAALEAKLADGAAACRADYVRLHVLNEQLGQQGSFQDAEACRDLNRYCDVLPYDDNRIHLGQPAARRSHDAGSSGGAAAAAAAADPVGATAVAGSAGAAAEGPLAPGALDGSSVQPGGQAQGTTPGAHRGRMAAPTAAAPGQGYINASPLEPRSPGDVEWGYIASQGPLKHTRDSFWQMVVEQRCGTIVMLTRTVERGTTKCASYFASAPRSAKAFGRFTVSTVSAEQLLTDLERRSLAVKDAHAPSSGPLKRPLEGSPGSAGSAGGLGTAQGLGQELGGGAAATRQWHATVQHYLYTAWPDHGVPPDPEPLLRMCQELRDGGAHGAPILVHCSAGIGRSGVFCVLDVATRRLLRLAGDRAAAPAAGADAVDVAALVAGLRRQRLGMVQTLEQYVFCHTALLHFIRQLAAELHPETPGAPSPGEPDAQQRQQQRRPPLQPGASADGL